jgi:predicted alpha-1,2-mannosidase
MLSPLLKRVHPILFFCITSCVAGVPIVSSQEQSHPSTWVDPFIGTARGGNTFPGAVRPWGMVSVSPHTDLSAPSGYLHDKRTFYGLGHVHLSGTGCSDLGSIVITAARSTGSFTPERYRTALGKESAEPGYYSAFLPGLDLAVEATASERCGITRFRSNIDGDIVILLDAGRSLALTGGGSVAFDGPARIEGFTTGGGFCGENNRHTVCFSAVVSKTPRASGTWTDTTGSTRLSAIAPEGSSVGAWMVIPLRRSEVVEIRVGISYVSTANASENLKREIGSRSFAAVRAEGRHAWNDALRRVRTTGGSRDAQVKFYTALYHSLLHPNIINDVNGEFPLMGHRGVGHYHGLRRYSVFSLWDTYRTLHPLLTLLFPERQTEMLRTMLDMYTETGFLPKWELAGNETFMMAGDPAVPVVADAYTKGLRGYDTALALAAMRAGATGFADSVRPGYADMLRLGFIPCDVDTTNTWWVWGPVSTMLEYCVADWSAAQAARQAGAREYAEEFTRRAFLYRNLFDPETHLMRPRHKDSTWFAPFDALATEGAGTWQGSGGPGYVEGNAWNYTWFVPFDVAGLATLFGGDDYYAAGLDTCFARGLFTITNEPDIAYPYLFTYFPGREHRTREIVSELREKEFGTGADGLPGNDDAGAISAWFVFSAMGLYPDCPGSGEYRLGVPLFDSISLTIPRTGRTPATIHMRRLNGPAHATNSMSLSWNGRHLAVPAIPHALLMQGGTLRFGE